MSKLSKIKLYEDLEDRILRSGELEVFKTFGLWNDQYEKESSGEINSIAYPAVFLEMFVDEWISRTRGIQTAKMSLVFHLGLHDMAHDYRQQLALPSYLHQLLEGFRTYNYFSPLQRISEFQDVGYTHITGWTVTYTTELIDNDPKELEDWREILADLELTGQIIKPNDLQ
jgi:hypothetical protein